GCPRPVAGRADGVAPNDERRGRRGAQRRGADPRPGPAGRVGSPDAGGPAADRGAADRAGGAGAPREPRRPLSKRFPRGGGRRAAYTPASGPTGHGRMNGALMIRRLPELLIEPVVRMALAEDLGRAGDLTGQACIPEGARMRAAF